MIDRIYGCCHKILPLVYDESLSYYEMLCKVRYTLNEVVDVVNDIDGTIMEQIGEYLTEHLAIPFYNVQQFGIMPNTCDNYQALHKLFKEKVNKTGGIVYFPRGKYTTSFTLFVPENTILCGEGQQSEIYFDETDTNFGVALSNGGSNVTICNIKVSQKSTGTMHSGAQPGCIGFAPNNPAIVDEPYYSHDYPRLAAKNLTVENVYFEGKYALQSECSSLPLENITYRNIYAPTATVGLNAKNGAVMRNVMIENVDCDLFRITESGEHDHSGYQNISVKNVNATTALLSRNRDVETDQPITIENMTVDCTRTINNDVYDNTTILCAFSGNFNVLSSKFVGKAGQTNGIRFYKGHIVFNDCLFDTVDKICTQATSFATDPDHAQHYFNCRFHNLSGAAKSNLVGYGNGNDLSQLNNYSNAIWGDMHYRTVQTGMSAVTSNFKCFCEVEGETVRLCGWAVKETDTNVLFTLNTYLANLPLRGDISGIAYKSADMTDSQPFYATLENGVVTSQVNIQDYNRFYIDCVVGLTRSPLPAELAAAFV